MTDPFELEIQENFRDAYFHKTRNGERYYRIDCFFVPYEEDQINICVSGPNAGFWYCTGMNTNGNGIESLKNFLRVGSFSDKIALKKNFLPYKHND